MQKALGKDWVYISGIIGIIGVLLTIVSDFILIGRPVSAYKFLMLGTESMAHLEEWRLTLGTFLGVIVLPFQIAGLIPLYFGLKPSGKVLSVVVFITAAHALIMGVAFHTSYAYIGSGWKMKYAFNIDSLHVSDLMNQFDNYWFIIILIMLIELLFISTCFTVMILKGKTLFPKWMSLFNPILISLVLIPLVFVLPAPLGGYLAPAVLNITTLVFMFFTFLVFYRNNIKKSSKKNIVEFGNYIREL